MNVLNCQRCGADVPMPNLSAEMKRKIIGIAHRVSRIRALMELRDQAGLGLAEAKSVAMHLSDEGHKCHRCHGDLFDEKDVVDCPKCRSLNLRW